MSLSITDHEGYNLAELKQTSFHGLPGIGCYTLSASLDFHVTTHRRGSTLEQLRLRIEWGDNTQSLLGIGHPDQAQPIMVPTTGSFTVSFRLCLSSAQLEGLEQRRHGDDFVLALWFYSTLVAGEQRNAIADRLTVQVSQSEWVKVLEGMRYQTTLLQEFGFPIHLQDRMDIAALVSKARSHFLNGRYNECVADCRTLLEACPLLSEDSAGLGRARNLFSRPNTRVEDNRELMTSKERMLIVRDAVKHAANYPHHHRSEGIEYNRNEARIILFSTLSLLPGWSPD